MRFVRKNERREVRRAVSLACQVVREQDFRLVAEEVLDVSPDGMLVAVDEELQPGDKVIVSFHAPLLAFGPGGVVPAVDHPGFWFDTEAEVARIVRGRRAEDRGRRAAGLSFSTLPRVHRFILRNHLRKVPPPLPRRPQRIDWSASVRSEA